MTKDEQKTLGRLEEKMDNIYHLTEKNEAHLRDLNGTILDHAMKLQQHDSDRVRLDAKLTRRTDTNRQIILGVMGLVGAAATILIALVWRYLDLITHLISK
uniref:Uncharacterized protein n=1 Tax=viral metagenome TaxID=1070528 RepID=A0A6M3JBA2_9ZZZZ